MHKSKFLNYLMFGLLYFTQGTVLAYFLSVNALYFNENGLSGLDLGIFSTIAMIPFVIKILYGMLSDRYALFGMGHRKPYILVGLAVQVVSLVLVPFIDLKSGYWLFVGVAFVLQMGMALYDTCTDGLALDSSTKEEEGTIQGFMVGGRAMGVVLISSVIGLLVERTSWSVAFYMLAVLTLAPLPLVLRVKEEIGRAHV